MSSEASGTYSGLTPLEMSKFREAERREAFFWKEGARASRAKIENERWLQDSDLRRVIGDKQLPAVQGARPKTFTSPPYKPDTRSGPVPNGIVVDLVKNKNGEWTLSPKSRQWFKRAIKLMNKLGQFNRAFDLIGALESALKDRNIIKDRYSIEVTGFRRCDGPYGPTESYNPPNGFALALGSLHCHSPDQNFQIGGQAWGGVAFIPITGPNVPWQVGEVEPGGVFGHPDWIPASINQFMIGYSRSGGAHWEEHSSFIREFVSDEPYMMFHTKPWVNSGTMALPYKDPNLTRLLPSLAQPAPQAIYSGEAANVPSVAPDGPLERYLSRAPDAWAFAWSASASSTQTGRRRGDIPRRPPVRPSEPPPPGAKEHKTISRIAKVTKLLYKALDTVSEWADVVDAIYEALPEDVRKRRPCESRGMGDSFGQYGISAADCKLKVLYDNWHKLDTNKAWKNIAKNALEDQLHGVLHKNRPKGTGSALRVGDAAFGKAINELLSILD